MSRELNKTNQWELDGDCNLCRKQKYCSKPCTKCKRETARETSEVLGCLLNSALQKYVNNKGDENNERN